MWLAEPKGGQRLILDPEEWMDLRRFRALYEAVVSISVIARETGHHWRTVKKYLVADLAGPPVAPSRQGTQPRVIDGWSLVVIATRLDLGPSRGLTSSFAGRPGACPMPRASLRALAPGQAGVTPTV